MKNTNFKKGDRVFHIQFGWGTIEKDIFKIYVRFDDKKLSTMYVSDNNLLSYTEYTLNNFNQENNMENFNSVGKVINLLLKFKLNVVDENGNGLTHSQAKQCLPILVDEIVNELNNQNGIDYWKEVKNNLEELY